MMRTLTVLVFFLVSSCRTTSSSLNCTGTCVADGDRIFVTKSFEWVSDHGALIFNPRGLEKSTVFMKRIIAKHTGVIMRSLLKVDPTRPGTKWTSKLSSVTYSQAGSLFPIGGINEAGLTVEALTNKGSKAEYFGTDSTSINELQWVSYQLDHYRTTQEVTENLRKLSIEFDAADMHFLVCDVEAKCAAIEYTEDGKLEINALTQAKVITNHSTSASETEYEKNKNNPPSTLEGASTTDGKESSLLRYQIARNNLQGLQAQLGQINFNTVVQKLLDPVWIEGFTKWNIVYEPRALKTSFRTQSFRDRFYEFDLTPFIPNGHCQQTPRQYFDFANLEKLSPTKQNINELFTPLTSEIEKDLIKEGLVKVVLPTLTKVLGKKSKQVANEMLTTFTEASFGTNGVKCVSTVD